MDEEQYMTLKQKMTLKAILESENPVYKIHWIGFSSSNNNNMVYIRVDDQKGAFIHPDGRITREVETEVEL